MAKRSIIELLIRARDETAGAFRSVGSKLKGLVSALLSMRAAVAAAATFIVAKIGRDIVGAFAAQEQAIIRLNAALRVTNRYTVEGTREIQRMAESLQKLTGESDDALLAVSTTIAQIAETLTTTQLAEAQKAAIGLARTWGIDLAQAGQLVAKAIKGEQDALSRYGVSVAGVASEQERFNIIMRGTAGFFTVAVESTKSLQGQILQATEAFGELKESLGEIIARSLGYGETQRTLADRITDLNARLRENLGTWVKWGRVVKEIFEALVRTSVTTATLLKNAVEALPSLFQTMLFGLLAGFEQIGKGFFVAINAIIEQLNKLPGIELALLDTTTKWDVRASEALKGVRDNATDARVALSALGESWKDVGRAIAASPPLIPGLETAGGGANLGGPTKLSRRVGAQSIIARPIQASDLGPQGKDLARVTEQIEQLKDAMAADPRTSFMAAFRDELLATADLVGTWQADFGRASAEAFNAFVDGSKTAGEALKAGLGGALQDLAARKAKFNIGEAIEQLAKAIGNPLAAGIHLASAAKHFAAAAAFAALAHGAGSFAAGSGGSGGGGGGSEGAFRSSSRLAGSARGRLDLHLHGGKVFDFNDPRVLDEFTEMLEAVSGRRATVIIHDD